MTKNKVLITIDWFLPGTKSGGPVRSYANLIEHFKRDFDFYVITRDTDYCETIPYQQIQQNTWNVYNENTHVFYVSKENLNSKKIKEVYFSKSFDVVIVNGIYSWYFSILPLFLFKNKPVKTIVSSRGMLNSQAFSVKLKKKKFFLFLAKLLGLYDDVIFHATNQIESESIKNQLGNKISVIVAPNLPRLSFSRNRKNANKKEGILNLVSIARISKEKGTLQALKGILEYSSSNESKIKFDLFGTLYNKEYWEQCEEVIKILPEHVEISYKGSVDSEKVPSLLENYDFLLMPSEGENFGHSILEALSVGLPVIISDNTPWKNLEEKKVGWDISLNNSQNLQNVLEIAINMDQISYNKWSINAFNLATAYYNNEEVIIANRVLLES